MLINDPNHKFSDFSKTTNENSTQFGVPTVLEASLCFARFSRESKDSMHRETVARQRNRRNRRFCDQCLRIHVKEKSTERYLCESEESQKILF